MIFVGFLFFEIETVKRRKYGLQDLQLLFVETALVVEIAQAISECKERLLLLQQDRFVL